MCGIIPVKLQFLHPAVILANVISANVFSDHAKLIT